MRLDAASEAKIQAEIQKEVDKGSFCTASYFLTSR